jgi:MFS superfamily sulfate permease-like transporter
VLGWVERLGRYGDVSVHPSASLTPGVVVYRLDDRLFFANARYFTARVREALRAAPTPARWLVFDAEAVTHIDATGLEALLDLAIDLGRSGITLVVARLRTQMQEQLVAGGVVDILGPECFYPTIRAAVAAFESAGRGEASARQQ